MATKRLKRSYREGDRARRYSRVMIRQLFRKERHQVKRLLHNCARDPDGHDLFIAPQFTRQAPNKRIRGDRRSARFGQSTKPRLLCRWLDKQVGQPWDQVYSRAVRLFDAETLSLHVYLKATDISSCGYYAVDEDGILCGSADYVHLRYQYLYQ